MITEVFFSIYCYIWRKKVEFHKHIPSSIEDIVLKVVAQQQISFLIGKLH